MYTCMKPITAGSCGVCDTLQWSGCAAHLELIAWDSVLVVSPSHISTTSNQSLAGLQSEVGQC